MGGLLEQGRRAAGLPLPQPLELNTAMGCSRTGQLHAGPPCQAGCWSSPGASLSFGFGVPHSASWWYHPAVGPAPPSGLCPVGSLSLLRPPGPESTETPGTGRKQGADYFLRRLPQCPRPPCLPFLKARNSKTLWTMETMMVSARRYGLVSSRATWGEEPVSLLALLWDLLPKSHAPYMSLGIPSRIW